MSAELIMTQFGNVLVAELEDGSVKSISAESAVQELRYVMETSDLPEDYDWTPLEIIREYLRQLAGENDPKIATGDGGG